MPGRFPILVLFFFLTIIGRSLGQPVVRAQVNEQKVSPQVKALQAALGNTTSDTARVNRLNQLAQLLVDDHLQAATTRHYLDQAIALAQQANYRAGLGQAQELMGNLLLSQGADSLAFAQYEAALANFTQLKDSAAASKVLYSYGFAHYIRSNYPVALERLFQVLRLAPANSKPAALATRSIGAIFERQQNPAQALQYYAQSLEISRRLADKTLVINALTSMSAIYETQGELAKAQQFSDEALQAARESGAKSALSLALRNAARLNLTQGKATLAETQLNEALAINQQHQYRFLEMLDQSLLAKLYLKTGRPAQAIAAAEASNRTGRLAKTKKVILENYQTLAQAQEALNNFAAAYQYSTLTLALKDSIFKTDKNSGIAELRYQYEAEKQRLLAAEQAKTIQRKERYQVVLVMGLLGLVVVAGLLQYRSAKLHRANRELTLKNEKISHQNQLITLKSEEIAQQSLELEAQRDIMRLMNNELDIHQREAQFKAEQLAEANLQLERRNLEVAAQAELLTELNDNLEAKIRERTAELEILVDSLTQTNTDLEQFSYIVSHNLRAPVASILGLANVFDKAELANPINLHAIEHLEKSALGLDTVIRDLNQILSIRNNLNRIKDNVDLPQLASATFTPCAVICTAFYSI
ncbi:MAG: tetratricopeptide repeat protein [Bernardetiaceae bacterium]|nr:tetratricopeptide repeat protein [Bernardetiaceae bacterium]